ncbi:hypothetical protein LTR08_003228 [Meristemomyces frigidus]|nr:hypothetical protein LTR08_003228 [Meristemomyces frigidus]
MSSGQKAAEETKSVFSQVGQASEDIRKNVNSYADNLLGGGNKVHGSTGIHPDAQKAGTELQRGVEQAGAKLDHSMNRNTTTGSRGI